MRKQTDRFRSSHSLLSLALCECHIRRPTLPADFVLFCSVRRVIAQISLNVLKVRTPKQPSPPAHQDHSLGFDVGYDLDGLDLGYGGQAVGYVVRRVVEQERRAHLIPGRQPTLREKHTERHAGAERFSI